MVRPGRIVTAIGVSVLASGLAIATEPGTGSGASAGQAHEQGMQTGQRGTHAPIGASASLVFHGCEK